MSATNSTAQPLSTQNNAQTLRVAVAYAPKTLNPATAADAASARVLQLTNPALLTYNNRYQPVPLAAACFQPKLTQVVCTLPSGKQARTFSDGTPLNAATVKTWFTYLQTNPRSPFSPTLEGISMQVSGPQQQVLTFTLPQPSLAFLNKLTEIPLAVPPQPNQPETPLSSQPGVGLYRLESADALGNVSLIRGAAGTSPARIQFITVADATTRLLKLKKNEVDIALNDLPPELYRWGLKQGWQGLAVPSSSYSYIGYNFRNRTLANPVVREAIAHAVDRPGIRQYLLGGLASPADTLLPPGHELAWPAPEEKMDMFEAEDMLDTVLFRGPDAQGGQSRAHFTLLTSTDALSQRIAQVIQQNLAQVGINISLQPTEWGAFYDRVRKGQFDMVLLAWTGELPPLFYYEAFHSSQIPTPEKGGGLNRGAVNHAGLNQVLQNIHDARTDDQLTTATIKAQQMLAQIRPYLPLFRRHHTLLMAPNTTGCTLTPDGGFKGLLTCQKH